MKTLQTLIRLIKDEVDRLKKDLAQMEERRQKYQDEHDELGVQLIREADVATRFPEASQGFAGFAKRTLDRQKNLIRNIALIQKEIDKKRDELLEGFSEQKKFEIALENKQMEAFKEAKRRDNILMDEVAIRGYNRKE